MQENFKDHKRAVTTANQYLFFCSLEDEAIVHAVMACLD